jgi:hypothetical protein
MTINITSLENAAASLGNAAILHPKLYNANRRNLKAHAVAGRIVTSSHAPIQLTRRTLCGRRIFKDTGGWTDIYWDSLEIWVSKNYFYKKRRCKRCMKHPDSILTILAKA